MTAYDGLRIFVGPVPDRDVLAGLWTPPASVADASGHVWRSVVWSALDCPGLWALVSASSPESTERVVTGTLEIDVCTPVIAGEDHVVLAWREGESGRTYRAGAAVLDAGGRIRAVARQTCVTTDRGIPLGWNAWQAQSASRT